MMQHLKELAEMEGVEIMDVIDKAVELFVEKHEAAENKIIEFRKS
jgi:hypothetical protein